MSGSPIRFAIVGAWNTLFGYCAFVALDWLLGPLLPRDAMRGELALILSAFVSVPQAYLSYKKLVFASRERWHAEFPRFLSVYFMVGLANLALLPVLIHLAEPLTRQLAEGSSLAKLATPGRVGQAACISIISAGSYLLHRSWSFRAPRAQEE